MKDGNETPGMEEGINTTFVTIGYTTVLRPLAIAGEKSPAKRVRNEKLNKMTTYTKCNKSVCRISRKICSCVFNLYLFTSLPLYHN